MATSIGDLNFGISADTKGLRKAISKLNEFRKVIDNTAKAQTAGAKKAAAAMIRQESAIKKAFQATLRLRQAQKKAGAPSGALKETTLAFKVLTGEMSKGALKTKDFTRSMDAFAAKTGRAQRAIKDLQKSAGGKGINKLAVQLRNLESASVLAIGPLSGLGARIRSLGAIAGRSKLRIVGLFAGITAGIVGLFKLSAAAINAGKVFESSMARFEAASGSIEIARKQMSFVIKTSQELGLRIDTSAKAFSRLSAAAKGTALEGEGARKVFLAVSKAAAALRLSSEEVEGTFRAIEQIMSKGTVQAEELRGQLGERLPGAFRLAAAAMDTTTARLGQMLKAGEILAEDFLPKLAIELEKSFGAKALDNVNSLTGAMNILSNQGLLFSQAFNRATGISKGFIGAIKALSATIGFLKDQLNNIIAALGAVLIGMAFLGGRSLLVGLLKVGSAIRGMALAMGGLNLVLAANPLIAVVSLLTRFAVVIGVVVAAFIGLKFWLDSSDESVDGLDDALEALKKHDKKVEVLGKAFTQLTSSIARARAETKVYEEVLGFMDRFAIEDVDILTLKFQTLGKVQALDQKILEALAKSFDIALGGTRKQLIEKVSDALFRVLGGATEAKAALDKFVLTENALRDSTKQIEELSLRLVELQKGQKAVDVFDNITRAVLDLRESFKDTNVELPEQARRMAELEKVLIAIGIATRNLTEDEKNFKLELAADKALRTSIEQLAQLELRFQAISKGQTALDYFDNIEKAVQAYNKALNVEGQQLEDRIVLEAAFRAVLVKSGIALRALSNDERDRIKAQREGEAAEKRFTAQIVRSVQQINILRTRIAALAEGPDSFEVFTKVTEKVMKFREALIKAAMAMGELSPDRLIIINELTREWQELLEANLLLTDRFARAGEQMASAVTDALEDIIIKGGKVSDMLRELAKEMLRVILRSFFLDSLQASLGSAFGNIFRGTPAGGSGGGSRGGGFGSVGAAHGLTFRVPGSGGLDKVPIRLLAKPGEIVSVRRPDQITGGGSIGGGDGVNITIHAPGADVGTIERIREMIRVEMVPQIIQASSDSTIARLRRPKFA